MKRKKKKGLDRGEGHYPRLSYRPLHAQYREIHFRSLTLVDINTAAV